MRKLITLITAMVIFCTIARSQTTEVSGDITSDTTWSGDTVKVTDNVWVHSQATLTVSSGVYVEFQGHYKVTVNGTLIAAGTQLDNITFTAHDDSDPWNGIQFYGSLNENDTSKIIYCNVSYSYADEGAGIFISDYDELKIQNSCISNNTAEFHGGGIYCDSSDITIENNNIKNNTCVYDGEFYGGAGIYSLNSYMVIKNNHIMNNSAHGMGGGIYCVGEYAYIYNNDLSNNFADWWGGAICLEYSGALIYNNLIYNNSGGI